MGPIPRTSPARLSGKGAGGPPFAVSETDLLGTDQLTSGLFCLSQQKDQGVFCGLLWLDLMETLEMGLIY